MVGSDMLLQSTVLFNMFAFHMWMSSHHSFMNMILEKKNYLAEDFSFFLKLIGTDVKNFHITYESCRNETSTRIVHYSAKFKQPWNSLDQLYCCEVLQPVSVLKQTQTRKSTRCNLIFCFVTHLINLQFGM